MISRTSLGILVAVLFVAFVFPAAGLRTLPRLHAQDGRIAATGSEIDEAKAELKKLGPPPRAFRLISRIIRPSVVSVVTTRKITTVAPRISPFGDDWPFEGPNPFEEFEKRYGRPREHQVRGMGSGVIVDKEGHILTNNHVVAGAEDIKVILWDETELAAELVGTDPKTDLAVIKLKDFEADKIVPAKLGDSNELEVGDWVLAVGAPFGLAQSVSAGIVSATGRTGVGVIRNAYRYENFIQTDAAINRGNSGGPLVSYSAEVIGINTAIATGTGAYQGVGFAIPSSMARHVMGQLISKGRVVRGYLGVVIREATEADVKELKLPKAEGVVVENVYPDTPAAKAGLEKKDVIIAIDRRATPGMEKLRGIIAETPPGKTVKLRVWRDGKEHTLDVVIEEQPDEVPTMRASSVDKELGITIQTLTDDIASRLKVNGKAGVYKGEEGVLVTAVVPESRAGRAGIKVKDLIKEIANRPVRSVNEYNRARQGLNLRKGVLLLVKTGEMAKLVLIK